MKIEDLNLDNYQGIGRLAAVYPWEDDRVIKLFHSNVAKDTVEYEFKILQELNNTSISTPTAYELIKEDNRIGIVMDRVEGKTLIKKLPSRWYDLKSLAQLMAETHFSIHQYHSDNLPSYREEIRLNISSISQLPEDDRNLVIKLLDDLPEDNVICHGDYHPDNVMIENESLEVIDWITATSGHSLLDVARTSMILQYSSPPTGLLDKLLVWLFRRRFHDHYLNHYLQISGYTKKDLEPFYLPIMMARLREGIEDEREVLLREIEQRLKKYR